MKVTKDYLKKLIKEEIAAMDDEASKKKTGHPGTPTTPDDLNALQQYYDELERTATTDRKTAAMAKSMADKIAITIPARYKYEENLKKFKKYLEGLKDEGNSYAEQALKDIVSADEVLARASTTERPNPDAPPEEDEV